MARKEDEIQLLIDRYELEKKARRNNKLNERDAQNFVDSIMTNYFLDNDNINFLESKNIAFFTFKDTEDCFCISGKKYSECCKTKLNPEIDPTYVPYVKSLLSKVDYAAYVARMDAIFATTLHDYNQEITCFFPQCTKKPVANTLYPYIALDQYVASHIHNPFDAKYEMGTVFFKSITEATFSYNGFCDEHFTSVCAIMEQNEKTEQDILILSLATIVYKLYYAMVHFKVAQTEFLNWYNSVPEDGYKAYMVVQMRKVSGILKGILSLYSQVAKNITTNSMARLQIWTIETPVTTNFWCNDVITPQVTPDDFKMVNSVNNVLLTPKYIVQTMVMVNKKMITYYLFEKLDEQLSSFVTQYQAKLANNKKALEAFISNCSLILADNIVFKKAYFDKMSSQEQIVLSALNKFRFESPGMGQEYIKMQFFAEFDKGNNFF